MTTAWYKIINHPKVNLSVDLFHLGVISPSKNFSKQHFKLRF
jgi:hypothetical protein